MLAQMTSELRGVRGGHELPEASRLSFERRDDSTLVIHLSGEWRLHRGLVPVAPVEHELAAAPHPTKVVFDAHDMREWDSSLVAFVSAAVDLCARRGAKVDTSGLPSGVDRLIKLAEAVPERKGARTEVIEEGLLVEVGDEAIEVAEGGYQFLDFLGEVTIAMARFLTGRARFRFSDLALHIQQCGADAFPIVTLISFLVGIILAFMGAVQLQQFGAAIYVADLVGIAMVRDMGAMMTAIIMAGRTGAAFAAALGTMKVTQEIDALTTMGISPMEFLVLPRVIALILMMPLLCAFADFVGILGGATVGVTMLNLSFGTYMRETYHALALGGVMGGLFKSATYGIIIAISGCLRGFQCGNSSSAVGDAATSAVVTGIIYIVIACGVFAFVFNILGF